MFFWPVLWGNAYFPWDFVAAMYPVQRFVGDSIRQGDFPLFQRLRDPDFDPTQTLLLEEPFTSSLTGRLAAPVDILGQTNNQVAMRVQVVDGDTLLFVGIPYYPGWWATVEGQPTRLYVAQHAFMALPLTPGEHTVRFDFRPASFVWGAWITTLGLLVWGCSPLWAKRILRFGR